MWLIYSFLQQVAAFDNNLNSKYLLESEPSPKNIEVWICFTFFLFISNIHLVTDSCDPFFDLQFRNFVQDLLMDLFHVTIGQSQFQIMWVWDIQPSFDVLFEILSQETCNIYELKSNNPVKSAGKCKHIDCGRKDLWWVGLEQPRECSSWGH